MEVGLLAVGRQAVEVASVAVGAASVAEAVVAPGRSPLLYFQLSHLIAISRLSYFLTIIQ